MHRKIGKAVANSDVDVLLCCGEYSKFVAEEAKSGKLEQVKYFENKEEILNYLIKSVKSEDVILFKASNGMKFFELCNKFVEIFSNSWYNEATNYVLGNLYKFPRIYTLYT